LKAKKSAMNVKVIIAS